MAILKNKHNDYLAENFGDRFNNDTIERKLYSHDVGEIPGLIKPLIGATLAGGVIQPNSQEELSRLLKWANDYKIKVVPRGKATSGYGGVLPKKGALVIDFFRMQKILNIESDTQQVTVQPGITWEALERALLPQNLMLRCYPTSYPSSTVGGWFSQGGAGIGSYHAGWFVDNVVSAKAVLSDGSIKDFSGIELDLLYEAEGITGFLSEITIKVMTKSEMKVKAVAIDSARTLSKFSEQLILKDIPLWSFSFINPKMASLRNQSSVQTHLGHAVEIKPQLPEKYIVTLAYIQENESVVEDYLNSSKNDLNIDILDQHIADHEWENRFKLMVIKRLGPSLIPSEVVIPLESLETFLQHNEKSVKQPLVKEGILIKKGVNNKPEIVILGFIPGDCRTFSYNILFGKVLSIMKRAVKLGGRPYSTGKYFSAKASQIIGREKIKRLKAFKKQADPKGILNPGKVFGGGVLSFAISMAWLMTPIIDFLSLFIKPHIGERIKKDVKNIPADVAWYAYTCSQCGYCIDQCDQFYGRGWESQSPRGKWYWLREYMAGREKWNQFMVDTFLVCTTCEICNNRCSAALPIEPSWMKLRGKLIEEEKRMTFPPFEMMTAALQSEGNIWAGYRKNRENWFPEELKDKHGSHLKSDVVYFAGCTASYIEDDIAIATTHLLDKAGVDFAYLGKQENCCGTPMLVAGKWDVFAKNMRANIAAVKQKGGKTVVTSCPACDMMWRHVYPKWAKKLGIEYNIEAKHYSELVADKLKSGEFEFPANGHEKVKVTWHDSCHMGRVSKVYEPPRELIKAIPGVEFEEMAFNKEEAHCCGSVLTLIKEPDVAAEIGKERLDQAVDVKAQKLLAICPCCEFQLRVSAEAKKVPIEIEDLAHFAASHLGVDLPDPNPEVHRQWAVFEAMIQLMTPQGFALLMGDMWDDLLDAMPLKMGSMMRFFGKIPFMLYMMKPLFPILFPVLLPKMMPKLMNRMLELVAKKIPMPDYMEEQMPVLMPKVMNNLMPHMVKDLVPLVSQPMIAYLTGKHKK